jgi:two-component system NarL family sensor kinase
MKLRQKIILFAITPLFVALCTIAFAVWHQATVLAKQQRDSLEKAYLATKEAELNHYITLATRSIDHLYNSGRHDAATLNEAKAILAKLDYGDDGYFYIYDLQGNNLMHPRQPELVGRNLWNLRDYQGNPTIQRLIMRAQSGGGVERYLWEKPSTHKIVPKLGYVVLLDKWNWVLGTGIYLDDVDAALKKIDTQSSENIYRTMLWIAAIAIAGVIIIAIAGLALNITEYKVADAKLKMLMQRVVRSQEEERARLSRDLHDGISQWLVSIKLQIESGIAKLINPSNQPDAARLSFERAANQLNEVLSEVRRISHNLRPAILDDLGLAAALEHLTHEFSESTSLPTTFEASGNTENLPEVCTIVFFRIAQEALTNIRRHANASYAAIHLTSDDNKIELTIMDNGVGFDVVDIAKQPKSGIGLRNMHERMETIGGQLSLISSISGTKVIATLPRGE